MALTKEEILNASDMELVRVDIPEWGGEICLKPMTGRNRDDFDSYIARQTKGERLDMKGVRVRLVALCLCDDKGTLMFSTPDDMKALNAKSNKVINDLFNTVQKINGIGDDEVKELVGNLEADPTAVPGSGSQDS